MKNRSAGVKFSLVCFMAGSFTAGSVLADWSGNQSQRGYNPGYGDFPPEDIEQRLFAELENNTEKTDTSALTGNSTSNPPTASMPPHAAAQHNYQSPAYNPYAGQRNANPYNNYNRYPGAYGNNRNMNFSGPWNNNNSGFNMPWGNNSWGNNSWGNNGNSMPWNNNSSFSGPWNSNGSSFSMPWGNNNGSSFSPWGNGNSWGW